MISLGRNAEETSGIISYQNSPTLTIQLMNWHASLMIRKSEKNESHCLSRILYLFGAYFEVSWEEWYLKKTKSATKDDNKMSDVMMLHQWGCNSKPPATTSRLIVLLSIVFWEIVRPMDAALRIPLMGLTFQWHPLPVIMADGFPWLLPYSCICFKSDPRSDHQIWR